MSTRGVIARPKGDEWEGRYHHFDGYPSGLGKTLWDLIQEWGVEKAHRVLIDEHTGWSTINGRDWTQEPGYDRRSAPACYCHGARHEDGWMMTRSGNNANTEWAYVIGALALVIEERVSHDWRALGSYPYDGPEPDWEKLDAGGAA